MITASDCCLTIAAIHFPVEFSFPKIVNEMLYYQFIICYVNKKMHFVAIRVGIRNHFGIQLGLASFRQCWHANHFRSVYILGDVIVQLMFYFTRWVGLNGSVFFGCEILPVGVLSEWYPSVRVCWDTKEERGMSRKGTGIGLDSVPSGYHWGGSQLYRRFEVFSFVLWHQQ